MSGRSAARRRIRASTTATEVLEAEPQLLLDNGGDLFVRYLEAPYASLIGATEETTSGRMRLEPLRERIGLPLLVINDSPIKHFAENPGGRAEHR